MSFMVKDTGGGGDFTPIPEGTHAAICNMVVDMGMQETTYLGAASVKHQCYIRWELPHERMQWKDPDGVDREGPMVIGKTYTVSLNEKANLRKDLEAWRGKRFTEEELNGFDLFQLLGVGCQVTVTHREKDGKTYSNVNGVAGWPKGMPRPTATECDLLKYSDEEKADFEKLPEWMREKIMKQIVQSEQPASPQGGGYAELDDEIPF